MGRACARLRAKAGVAGEGEGERGIHVCNADCAERNAYVDKGGSAVYVWVS